jgi:hypothetical protein
MLIVSMEMLSLKEDCATRARNGLVSSSRLAPVELVEAEMDEEIICVVLDDVDAPDEESSELEAPPRFNELVFCTPPAPPPAFRPPVVATADMAAVLDEISIKSFMRKFGHVFGFI